eukprot:TRINITY_DN74284_c0_g1_i1.p1 TRINITY_DN74284_c0_g1~~TRINITY_DN74284_c0_g1_i1.p1  ORF type:complete len:1224 (-),score=273.79 TRINITY_DN74284_c0_g1_i1:374-3697(-)
MAVEKHRIANEAANSTLRFTALTTKLDIEDMLKESEALRATAAELDAVKKHDAVSNTITRKLDQAEELLRERKARSVHLLQVNKSNVRSQVQAEAKLQTQYDAKQEEIAQLQQQHFTAMRSLDVLTKALANEAAYLAGIRSLCEINGRVSARITNSYIEKLHRAPLLKRYVVANKSVDAASGVEAAAIQAAVAAEVNASLKKTGQVGSHASTQIANATLATPSTAAEKELKKADVANATEVARSVAVQNLTKAKTAFPVVVEQKGSTEKTKDKGSSMVLKQATTSKVVSGAENVQHSRAAKRKPRKEAVSRESGATSQATEVPARAGAEERASPSVRAGLASDTNRSADVVVAPASKHTPVSTLARKRAENRTFASSKHATPAQNVTPATAAATQLAVPASVVHQDVVHPKLRVQVDKGSAIARTKHAQNALGEKASSERSAKPDFLAKARVNATESMKQMLGADVDDSADFSDDALSQSLESQRKTEQTKAAIAKNNDSEDEDGLLSTGGNTRHAKSATTQAHSSQASNRKTVKRRRLEQDAPEITEDSVDVTSSTADTDIQPVKRKSQRNSDTTDASSDADDLDLDAEVRHAAAEETKRRNSEALVQKAKAFASRRSASNGDQEDDSDLPDFTKDESLEQMVSDFEEEDNDDTPAPAHAKNSKDHKAFLSKSRGSLPNAKRATPAPEENDNVVYDDDDLPMHKPPISSQFGGGWQAFVKTAATKPKEAPDVAMMEHLSSSELPAQYSAWKPTPGTSAEERPVVDAAVPVDQAAIATTASDDSTAEDKDFDQLATLAASFAQISASRSGVKQTGGSGLFRLSALLRAKPSPASTVAVDPRKVAAAALLKRFADVLRSSTLLQLANMQLDSGKLALLAKKLKQTDPLAHPQAPLLRGSRELQAKQWCSFFEEHAESSDPLKRAVGNVSAARTATTEAAGKHAALVEEIDARTQLQRTVEQDAQSLSSLLAAEEERVKALTSQVTYQTKGEQSVLSVVAAMQSIEDAHEELRDAVDSILQQRRAVAEAQRVRLVELQSEAQNAKRDFEKKKTAEESADSRLAAARKQLDSIRRSCDAAHLDFEHRRHAGHMEARAVQLALEVLGVKLG